MRRQLIFKRGSSVKGKMWRNQPVILAIGGPLCISLTVGRVSAECYLFKQKSLCIPDLYGMSYGLDRTVRARNFQPELKIVVSQAARKRAVRCLDPLQARSCPASDWKWRKRSSVKITERTHEKATEALHGTQAAWL